MTGLLYIGAGLKMGGNVNFMGLAIVNGKAEIGGSANLNYTGVEEFLHWLRPE